MNKYHDEHDYCWPQWAPLVLVPLMSSARSPTLLPVHKNAASLHETYMKHMGLFLFILG